jgi:hypothetical protein
MRVRDRSLFSFPVWGSGRGNAGRQGFLAGSLPPWSFGVEGPNSRTILR